MGTIDIDVHLELRESATPDDLAREHQALRVRLEDVVETYAKPAPQETSVGSKGVLNADLAHLIVTALPVTAVVTAIGAICVERIRRGTARTIRLKHGDHELELSAVDSASQIEAVRVWADAIAVDNASGDDTPVEGTP